MPLIVRILAEDLAGWELENRTAKFYHYRPSWAPQAYEQIQLLSPEPLGELVGKDMVCFVNMEKGWKSKKLGKRLEVKFQLRHPAEPIRDARRVRLRGSVEIDHVKGGPPRVELEEIL